MRTALSVALFTLALAIGTGSLLSGCEVSEAKSEPPPKVIPQVGVIDIRPRSVTLTTELAGRTAAYLVAEVRPQVSGIIQQRLFKEGGRIEAGQVLYQIDPAMLEAAVHSADAAVKRDRASLSTARLKVTRYKKLLKTQAVSQEAYDDAVAALAEARAVVAVSQAALETARINLDYTQVTAPISGRIGRSAVTVGALVTANQAAALATVRQLDPIYVDLRQSSVELLNLRHALENGTLQHPDDLDAHVRLILEDEGEYRHKGQLQFSEVSVSESTGTVTLRAVFPNPDGELLPGMYVRAIVEEGVDPDAIVAPQRGIGHDSKGRPTALLLNDNGRVEQRLLQVARSLGDQWLVSEGLESGDRLIVDGLQKVRPGATAQAVASPAE